MPKSSLKSRSSMESSQAEKAKSGYLEYLEQEGAKIITPQIKRCKPNNLTLFEDEFDKTFGCRVLPTPYRQFLNQALPVVTEEIDNALEAYPNEACQKFFANSEVYNKLTAYVLSKIPAVYTVIESLQTAPKKPRFPSLSLELRLYIEAYIHQGIKEILRDYSKPKFPPNRKLILPETIAV